MGVFRLICALCFLLAANTYAQVTYNSVNLIVNVSDVTYNTQLASNLKLNTLSIPGVTIDNNPNRGWSWPNAVMQLTIDKAFTCSGVSTNKVVLVAADAETSPTYLIPKPISLVDEVVKAAFIHGYKVKLSRVVCVHSPINSNDKFGLVFAEKDITPIPALPASNASWINGVVVNSGGTTPPNPVSTNWGFEITTAGTYEVYAHWVANKNTVSNVSYAFDGQAATATNLDQNISSGIWVKLGASKAFTTGSHNVTIAVDPTAFYVVDGIKVERVQ